MSFKLLYSALGTTSICTGLASGFEWPKITLRFMAGYPKNHYTP